MRSASISDRRESIAGKFEFDDLLAALKFLELPEEQAFVMTSALYPSRFGHAEAIRLFLERYQLCHRRACGGQGPRLEGGDACGGIAGALACPRDASGGQQSGQTAKRSARRSAPDAGLKRQLKAP